MRGCNTLAELQHQQPQSPEEGAPSSVRKVGKMDKRKMEGQA